MIKENMPLGEELEKLWNIGNHFIPPYNFYPGQKFLRTSIPLVLPTAY